MTDETDIENVAGAALALSHAVQSLLRVLTHDQKVAFQTELRRFQEPGQSDAYRRVISDMNRNARV